MCLCVFLSKVNDDVERRQRQFSMRAIDVFGKSLLFLLYGGTVLA